MTIKKVFDSVLKEQQDVIARQALAGAFGGQLPGHTTMDDLMKELQSEPPLWDAFLKLRVSELREMISPTTSGARGPSRKRGVTSRRIVEYVTANPGCTRNDIMQAVGIKGGTASSQLRMLRLKGRLKTEGTERDFRYFPGK